MAGRKRKTAGFSIGDKNYNITKNDDGSYELELGNRTDSGWYWNGSEPDLVGALIRLKSSNADTSQIEEHWDEIKKDALKNINHEDWFYMLSGDNSRWEFGNDNDYIYDAISWDLDDTEQWGELSEEVKDEVLNNNEIYPPTFSEFKEKEIEFSIQDIKHALSLDSFSEFSSEVNDIQENIETSFRESMDEKIYSLLGEQVDNAKNKFPSDLDEDDDRYNPDYIGNPAPKEKSDYIGDIKYDKSYDENQMNMFSIRKIKSILIKESYGFDPLSSAEYEDVDFYYVIDLNERGSFQAHVENNSGDEIWSVDESEMEMLIEDGFLKNTHDVDGIKTYLLQQGLLPEDVELEIVDN